METALEPEEHEMTSPPISSAIHSALELAEGKITSPAVKLLDKQILEEMSATHRIDVSNFPQEESSDENDEDKIFERLLKTQGGSVNFPPIGNGKSLMEEIEEKQLLFPERAPVHLAVVQGRNGANSLLLSGGQVRLGHIARNNISGFSEIFSPTCDRNIKK